MAAMVVVAVNLDRHFLAELRPAGAAMVADGAAFVMMHHDALANLGERWVDRGADGGNDATGLVPGNGGFARRCKATCFAACFRPAVLAQVAAAHARRPHLDDDLVRSWGRVGEVHQLEFASTGED